MGNFGWGRKKTTAVDSEKKNFTFKLSLKKEGKLKYILSAKVPQLLQIELNREIQVNSKYVSFLPITKVMIIRILEKSIITFSKI